MDSGEVHEQFLRTLHKTKNLKRSLQALYNSDLPLEELQNIIEKSSTHLSDLQGLKVDFSKYKKTKSVQLHKRRLTDKHIESLQTDQEVKANVGAYKRKLMGLGDIIEGAESIGRTILGLEDGDDEVTELPRPAGASSQQPPAKKQKTRPVGMTAAQLVGEATGILPAARLAKKVNDLDNYRKNDGPFPELTPIRGKDEVKEDPNDASQGPGGGLAPTPGTTGSSANDDRGFSVPYQESDELARMTFDSSLDPVFAQRYGIVQSAVNEFGLDHPETLSAMRRAYRQFYRSDRGLKPMQGEPPAQVVFDAFNALVASKNGMYKTPEPPVENPEPGIMSSIGSTLMGAVSAVSEATGVTAVGRAIGDAVDSVTPTIIKNVAEAMQPQSASNIPIQHDPLTVVEAVGILGRAAASSLVGGVLDAATLPVRVVEMGMANMMGGEGIGGNDQADLLARDAILDPRDDFKFGMMPPRMSSMPALAAPNGLGNVMAFEDAPLTSRISPLVERILNPPNTRPIPSSQPEGGRLAMQAFQNYQQDIEAPYAVRR